MQRRDTDGVTRRRLLAGGALVATEVSAGCLGRSAGSDTETDTDGDEAATDTTASAPGTGTEREPTTDNQDLPEVAGVAVTDFIEYPLSGTHPHVHNRAATQYVVVRVTPSTGRDDRAIREGLTLTVGGATASLATRQPVPWQRETVDVAFAVSKTEAFDDGAVEYEGTVLHRLEAAALDRLNSPPRFSVSDLGVSPAELDAGEQTTATVRFTLANTGEGAGTFGASLTGNYLSGSATVTARLDASAEREVVDGVDVVGRGEQVTVGVDWGIEQRRLTIPVVGATTTPTETATPNATTTDGGQ